MTPDDIATSIAGLNPVGGDLATMTTGTQSWVGNGMTIDDANTFG